MGKIKQSTIYVLLFIIAFLVILSINKLLAMVLLLIVLCILIGKNLYLGKIIKANKLYASKNYGEALKLYRQTVTKENIPGFIINNYLIMELKYGDCTIAENYINSLSLDNSKIKSTDLLSINISKSLVAWKNNKTEEAINNLKRLLEEDLEWFLRNLGEGCRYISTLIHIPEHTHKSTLLIQKCVFPMPLPQMYVCMYNPHLTPSE